MAAAAVDVHQEEQVFDQVFQLALAVEDHPVVALLPHQLHQHQLQLLKAMEALVWRKSDFADFLIRVKV